MRGTRGGLLAIDGRACGGWRFLVGNGGAAATSEHAPASPRSRAFSNPTYVTALGDASRLFVVEADGGSTANIRLVLNGAVQATPFLTVTGVAHSFDEQGLFSMAFAPDYASSGRFYVYYTRSADGAIQIDEFMRDAGDPNIARPGHASGRPHDPAPAALNHNGGQLQFGPDGMLYIGIGDGGGGGRPAEQRAEPERPARQAAAHRPEADRARPVHGSGQQPVRRPGAGARPEIWAYGLRNPWRFSFDRLTGDLYIGDVGQNAYEEIDYQPVDLGNGRGVNFGWRCREGRHLYPNGPCSPPPPNMVDPVWEYTHSGGNHNGCSISGGYVVRDQEVSDPPRALPLQRLLQREHLFERAGDSGRDRRRADGVWTSTSRRRSERTPAATSTWRGRGAGTNVFRIRQTDPPGQSASRSTTYLS